MFDEIHTKDIRRGISKVIKPAEGLVDHLIHHQDIRRPLGRPRVIPADRLVAALDVVPGLGGFVGAKQRVAGLRLVATDVDWSHGSGPEVTGPGEAILLAASGRPAGLEDLSGEGADRPPRATGGLTSSCRSRSKRSQPRRPGAVGVVGVGPRRSVRSSRCIGGKAAGREAPRSQSKTSSWRPGSWPASSQPWPTPTSATAGSCSVWPAVSSATTPWPRR